MQGVCCEVDDFALRSWAQVVDKALFLTLSFDHQNGMTCNSTLRRTALLTKYLKGGGGQYPFPKEVWSPAGSFSSVSHTRWLPC